MRTTGMVAAMTAICIIMSAGFTAAESLREKLEDLFIQGLQVQRSGGVDDPFGATGSEAVQSNARVISALSSLVASNLSTFPISSVSSGLIFDFAGGMPVAMQTSKGPIFSEKAQTIGKGKMSVGVNFTQRNLGQIRGLDTEDIIFNFVHRDTDGDGFLGENNAEYDMVELQPNLDFDATVLATYWSYGLSERFDIGVAIPIVSIDVTLNPQARIASETFARTGGATYYYAGTSSNPILAGGAGEVTESATGIGDIALRGKYHFLDRTIDMAFLGELRLPVGSEDDFIGTGTTTLKMMVVSTWSYNDFSPHLNIGYDLRGDKDGDELELTLGWDQRISDRWTLAVDWLGEFEIGGESDDRTFPDPVVIGPVSGGQQVPVKVVEPSNIPNQTSDDILNVSFGAKYSPSEKVVLMGNFILPTNDDGLRSSLVTTFGIEIGL